MARHALFAALLLGLGTLLSPHKAQAETCRLALLLAIDVSSSVDKVEYALQTKGLAAALISPSVTEAFLASPDPVALAIFEWSGRYNQTLVQGWRLIRSAEDLLAVAEGLAAHPRSETEFPTAMGYALGHASTLMQTAPPCDARTVDISGDGKNNEGFGPKSAYRAFPFKGITVNGLAINGADFEAETDLLGFYSSEVLHGPGAFLEVANGFEDFERAMRRKLEREVAPGLFGALPTRAEEAG